MEIVKPAGVAVGPLRPRALGDAEELLTVDATIYLGEFFLLANIVTTYLSVKSALTHIRVELTAVSRSYVAY